MTKPLLAVLLAATAVACSTPEPVANEGVLLDGLFDEWSEATGLIDDPPDAPDAAVDVLSVQALDDPSWLYLALDVGHEVAIQALPGTLHLLLDVDADAGSGGPSHGMQGVDLIVDLSQKMTPPTDGRGAGFAVHAVSADGRVRPVERYALGLMAAPTWAAPRFELRLSRSGGDDVPPLGRRVRIGVAYEEAGAVVDETEVGSYAFTTEAEAEPTVPEVAARLEKDAGTHRVAVWNVASRSFTRRPEAFARVLSGLEPDVVLLDELPGDATAESLAAFFGSPPLGELGTWSVALGGTGGVQRAAIAARGRRLEPAIHLTEMPYPAGALEARFGTIGEAPTLVEAEAARGVSAVGAWIELDGQRVLFVSADLQSGGFPGSVRDRLRLLQANAIRSGVVEELRSGPAPVLIGGDLNLVASRAPLFALVGRLDVDGSDLVPVDAQRLGERTLATWRNPRDLFAPGRLDFLLVPDAAVSVTRSFVFATEDLDDRTLERLGLERDTSEISDHLVVVADLAVGGDRAAASDVPARPQD